MTANILHAAPLAGLRAAFGRGWTAFVAGVDTVVKSLQWARMTRVLSDMSDAELARIGIARRDIPAKAREMVFQDA